MHLLLRLPNRRTEGRPMVPLASGSGLHQDVLPPPFCRPFDLKKEETQAAGMADWFYVVGLSQNEEIARRDPGRIHRFLIELICKEHLNPNFYAYHTVWSVHSTPPLTTKSTATTLNNIGLDTFHLNTAMRSLSKALVTNFGIRSADVYESEVYQSCFRMGCFAPIVLMLSAIGICDSYAQFR